MDGNHSSSPNSLYNLRALRNNLGIELYVQGINSPELFHGATLLMAAASMELKNPKRVLSLTRKIRQFYMELYRLEYRPPFGHYWEN